MTRGAGDATRDRLALFSLCGLAVAVRAVVLLFHPGIIHPDEVFQYAEPANRLIHGSGLVPWEYQVGARNWLAPGLIAGCMALGDLFGPRPEAPFAAVSVLLCAVSLGPVVCAFLWGRRCAGFAGAVTAGLLAAVWYQLVYFSTHLLAETLATPPLVVGLYLLYPGEPVRSPRRLFVAGLLLGLAIVFRLQLAPAVGIAAIAVLWGEWRGRYPALLTGLATPLLLCGVLDWVTWGWPFQSFVLSVYYNMVTGVAAAYFGVGSPLYYAGLGWFAWGPVGLLIVPCALWGGRRLPLLLLVAAVIYIVHSVIGHKEERFVSPALPLIMILAGIGSVLAAGWLGRRASSAPLRRALLPAVPVGWAIASFLLATAPQRVWYWNHGRGSILAMRAINADPGACGVAVFPAFRWFYSGGYTHLRPGLPLYAAGSLGDAGAARAFNYVITYRPADFSPLGYVQDRCWDDPADRLGLVEPICLWHRPGLCEPSTAQPMEAAVERFNAVILGPH
jgi:hypothetical protein